MLPAILMLRLKCIVLMKKYIYIWWIFNLWFTELPCRALLNLLAQHQNLVRVDRTRSEKLQVGSSLWHHNQPAMTRRENYSVLAGLIVTLFVLNVMFIALGLVPSLLILASMWTHFIVFMMGFLSPLLVIDAMFVILFILVFWGKQTLYNLWRGE